MRSVLLLGMGPTSTSALDSLVTRFRVLGVVRDAGTPAEPDAEVERRAKELDVPVLRVAYADLEDTVLAAAPDCVVISSYSRILGERLLASTRFVNVHYSPLPRYRGRANVPWAIINGEPEAAISIHRVVPALDAGNILFQQTVPIGPDDTAADVYARLNAIQREQLADAVERHLDGDEGTPQDESRATYGSARVPDDGEIDWSQPTAAVYAVVRALSAPFPGARTYLGSRRLVVVRAAPLDEPHYAGRVPGRVVGRSKATGSVDVLTGDGVLRLFEVAVEGGAVVPAADVVTSTRQTLGLRTADLLARIDELERRVAALTAEVSRSAGTS
jgi:methionyl-tRNA formyltransferase